MSPLRPHPKSLSQSWERDFERFFSPSPNIGKACPELVEGGVGDEGNTGICKRDMLPVAIASLGRQKFGMQRRGVAKRQE